MEPKKLLTMLLLLISVTGFSQELLREKKEQIKSLKVAFITDELKLTTTEAEKFWPLYNAFDARQSELRQEKVKARLSRMDGVAIDQLSEKDAAAMVAQIEDNEDELYQNRKKFVSALRGVLPASKILKLKKAEEDFNRKLLRQYRDKFRK